MNKGRNGKIELLRFVFSVCILFFHLSQYILGTPKSGVDVHLNFFSHGSIGVEFFFLVSGYLMAKTAYKQVEVLKVPQDDKSLSKNYLQFIGRKYFGIFPYHLVAFVLAFITYVAYKHLGLKDIVLNAFQSIPNLLLIERTGFEITNPNNIEWYISCMLLVMAVLYPLCIRFYYRFTRLYAPLLAVFLLGYMQKMTSSLTGVNQWNGYKSMVRAIAEIALGTVAFEIVRYMQSREWKPAHKALFTATEVACLVITMIYILYNYSKKLEILILLMLFILVILAFSSLSYGAEAFNNKSFCFLGSLSLPLYLAQMPAIYVAKGFFDSLSLNKQAVIAAILTVVFTALVKIGGDVLDKAYKNKKKKTA